MTIETTAHAIVEQDVIDQASAIYAAAGMTVDQAFRLLLVRTVADQSVPFDTFIPNAETVAAMEAARRGEVFHAKSIDDLFDQLHADD